MLRILRATLIVVVTIVLSTLATNALDMGGSLGDSVIGTALAPLLPERSLCADGMVYVTTANGDICIDAFEVSPNESCPHDAVHSPSETVANLETRGCKPEPKKGRMPWVFISQTQAQRACAAAGKRLPSAEEWYLASLGTPDPADEVGPCVISTGDLASTGSVAACASFAGAFDMIGNAWEWSNDVVINGEWRGRELPPNGFVESADTSGIAITTNTSKPNAEFGEARFASDASMVGGMLHGGYFNSGEGAGIFAVYAASPPSFTGNAVGFRCVSTVQ